MDRLAAICLALSLCAACAPAPEKGPPNFVVILTDDQGYGDIGAHGNEQIRTPHLDRFAAGGVELTRFYVEPVCAPTRAALLTGRYYYRSGVIHTSRGGAKMHGNETTLAEMLRGAGYRTGLFGKWHLGDNRPMRPEDQGFDDTLWHRSGGIDQAPDKPNSYFDPHLWRNGEPVRGEGYCTDVFFDAALEFIAANRERPFFVYLPTNAPHTPLQVDERYVQPYLDQGLQETTAKVYGMVENIDENVGRLLAHLDETGLREDTVVVFLSDNGPQQSRYTAGLRGRKGMTYEGGVRALSFWQWPGRFPRGRRIAWPAAHIDVAPTLLELAGVAAPAERPFDGLSLAPLLLGAEQEAPQRTLFFQCHRGLEPKLYQNAAAIGPRFKLVMGPETFNVEDLVWQDEPPLELYDLSEDPGETRDLAAEQPDQVAALRAAYEAWFADVRSTRNFTPGRITIGAEGEDSITLCRYQDSTYRQGRPAGWGVVVEQAGRYEATIKRGDEAQSGELWVSVDGVRKSYPVAAGSSSTEIELPAGPAQIEIWFQQAGEPREVIVDNSTLGDVTLRRLD